MTPSAPRTPPEILERARQGDPRMLARAISQVESGHPGMRAAMAAHRPRRRQRAGAPQVVGISGPPGAGKSSLVDHLIRAGRNQDWRVAVLAVDPSSPFSGGAILGDRVRMIQHAGDPGVFVRSLSSRGHVGGLSMTTGELVDLLDICLWDLVLVETVGVGQSEIAVMEVADTVAVVLTPESGDTVQTMKAGLLEIADLFVVNKADRPGASILARELEMAVEMEAAPGWRAPVLVTSALRQEGIEAVMEAFENHRTWCRTDGSEEWLQRRGRGRVRACLDLVADHARRGARERLESAEAHVQDALRAGTIDPWHAFRLLVRGEGDAEPAAPRTAPPLSDPR